MSKKQKNVLTRIIIAGVLTLALHFLVEAYGERIGEPVWLILHMVPYLIVGYDILWKAFKGILHGQIFDENFLMCVATIGAIALALVERSADYMEAIAVMLFYQIGEFFQSYAIGKSRKNISEMMDIRPDYAVVEENGELVKVDPDEVAVGTVITVRPGEKVPIDGVVVSGAGTVDTAALTGESAPREIAPGDAVTSGVIDQNAVFKIRTTKEFEDSTVSKILDLVENATSQKAKSEAFISRFARVYTPIVCLSALLLALFVPAVRLLLGMAPAWKDWVYRALTFLVISCPCALVISIPLSFFAGIGGASRQGVLIKGSNYLEALAKTGMVAFDKTGTMTKGVFEVNAIHKSTIDRTKLLEIAAHAESYSSHPIAKSIERAYLQGLTWDENGNLLPVTEDLTGRRIDRSRVTDLTEITGNGIITKVEGWLVVIGNTKLMEREGIAYRECEDDFGTVVHLAVDGEYVGHILISDVVKPTSAEAIKELHRIGITRTVMLTGDSKLVGEKVASEIGISEVQTNLLPADKVTAVEQLLREKKEGTTLAFVGDGINDAPVLTRADLGIAMGALGADAAIEAADVVLMDDDPKKIGLAVRIAKKCMRIVHQNIYGAIGIKVVVLILGALGISSMWLAIFADTGVMILAVLNAIRALFIRK